MTDWYGSQDGPSRASEEFRSDPVRSVVLPRGTPEFDNWYNYFSNLDNEDGDLFRAAESQYGELGLKLMWVSGLQNWQETQFVAESIRLGLEPLKVSPRRGPGGGGPTKAQQYAAAEAAIRNQAYTLGYTTITDPQISSLARTAVDNNWSGEQLNDRLVNDATSNWDKLTGGTILAAVDAIKAGASSQLIGISDVTARQWAKRMASGELDQDGLRDLLQSQASARYGWAAEVIQRGITMSDFLAPSRDRIAQELEVNPEKLDMTNPKIMEMMTVVDKNGRRVANDTELARNARRDERWKSTGNARNMLSSAAIMIRRYVEGS